MDDITRAYAGTPLCANQSWSDVSSDEPSIVHYGPFCSLGRPAVTLWRVTVKPLAASGRTVVLHDFLKGSRLHPSRFRSAISSQLGWPQPGKCPRWVKSNAGFQRCPTLSSILRSHGGRCRSTSLFLAPGSPTTSVLQSLQLEWNGVMSLGDTQSCLASANSPDFLLQALPNGVRFREVVSRSPPLQHRSTNDELLWRHSLGVLCARSQPFAAHGLAFGELFYVRASHRSQSKPPSHLAFNRNNIASEEACIDNHTLGLWRQFLLRIPPLSFVSRCRRDP